MIMYSFVYYQSAAAKKRLMLILNSAPWTCTDFQHLASAGSYSRSPPMFDPPRAPIQTLMHMDALVCMQNTQKDAQTTNKHTVYAFYNLPNSHSHACIHTHKCTHILNMSSESGGTDRRHMYPADCEAQSDSNTLRPSTD